jgi:hypothetical protein
MRYESEGSRDHRHGRLAQLKVVAQANLNGLRGRARIVQGQVDTSHEQVCLGEGVVLRQAVLHTALGAVHRARQILSASGGTKERKKEKKNRPIKNE